MDGPWAALDDMMTGAETQLAPVSGTQPQLGPTLEPEPEPEPEPQPQPQPHAELRSQPAQELEPGLTNEALETRAQQALQTVDEEASVSEMQARMAADSIERPQSAPAVTLRLRRRARRTGHGQRLTAHRPVDRPIPLSGEAAQGDKPLVPGRRAAGGFGIPAAQQPDEGRNSPQRTGRSSSFARLPRRGQKRLDAALHSVSQSWSAPDISSGSEPAEAWAPLPEPDTEAEAGTKATAEQAAAAEAAAERRREGAAWTAAITRRAESSASSLRGKRPASAPPASSGVSSSTARQQRRARPASASSRPLVPPRPERRLAAVPSVVTFASIASVLDAPRRRRRKKPPLPAFKERPKRMVCRPPPAPQRLMPGRAELLPAGWARVEPFDPSHPCYFWHARWKRGTWAHPLEPGPEGEEERALAKEHALSNGQSQEAMRLDRVAALADFRVNGG